MKACCKRSNCVYDITGEVRGCCWFCRSQSECEFGGVVGPCTDNPKTCSYLEMVEEGEV